MPIFLRSYDFYLALLLLIVGSVGAWTSLDQVAAHQRTTQLMNHPLRMGTRHFNINSSKGCVGSLQVSLQKMEGEKTLKLNAELRTRYQDRKATVLLDGEAVFNLIGQLGGAFATIRVEDTRVVIGFENINPIKLSIISPGIGPQGRREIEIPGPIELSPLGQGLFTIRYAPLGDRVTAFQPLVQQYATTLGITLEEVADSEALCRQSSESLSLESLGASLQQLRAMQEFLPRRAWEFAEGEVSR